MFNFCIQNHDVAMEEGKPINDAEMYRCYMKNLISRICYSADDFKCKDNEYDKYIDAIFEDKKELKESDHIGQSLNDENSFPTCVTRDNEKYFKESELKYIFDFINNYKKRPSFIDPSSLYDSLNYFLSDKGAQEHVYNTIKSLVKVTAPRYRINGYR